MKFFSSVLSCLVVLFLTIPSLLMCSDEQPTATIYLAPIEVQEIFNNPDISYVYLGKEISYLYDLVNHLCTLDTNDQSLICALKRHLEMGYNIGRIDAVLQSLEEAQNFLQKDSSANIENLTSIQTALDELIAHIKNDRLTINAQILSLLKDMTKNVENSDESEEFSTNDSFSENVSQS